MSDEGGTGPFTTFQLQAYDRLVQAIADFDMIEEEKFPISFCEGMMHVMSAFSRGYIFFDAETIRIFNEKISVPWKEGEFNHRGLERQEDAKVVYDTMRHKLCEVTESVRDFLVGQFSDYYE